MSNEEKITEKSISSHAIQLRDKLKLKVDKDVKIDEVKLVELTQHAINETTHLNPDEQHGIIVDGIELLIYSLNLPDIEQQILLDLLKFIPSIIKTLTDSVEKSCSNCKCW